MSEREAGEWRSKAKPPSAKQIYEAEDLNRAKTEPPPSRVPDGRTSRSPLKRFRRGDWARSRQPSPPEDEAGSRFALGVTGGVVPGGAWAARWEIASLLEARCNPS